MFDGILEVIKRTGVFVIFAQTLLNLCAGEVYEKYIKILVGLITAVMLIFPIVEAVKKDALYSFEVYRIRYEKEFTNGELDFEQIRDERWGRYVEAVEGNLEE